MHVKMSPEIDKLAPALVRAINDIQGVTKDSTAGGGAKKYKYAKLDSCLDEARRALSPHGLTVIQPPATQVITSGSDGERVVPMVATILMHESGQWIAGEMLIPEFDYDIMTPVQGMGSTITYMRRYSICAMLSIPMEDDDGATPASRPQYQAQRYDQRDDRRPAYNGNGRSEPPRQAPAARPSTGAADRLADSVPRQPAARPAPRPPVKLDDVPIDDSFGEPPPQYRR